MSKTTSDLSEVRSEERAHAEQVISRLDIWATAMDTRFRIPFTPIRFGIDPIVGLIPGAGDVLGALLSAYIFGHALKNGMPKRKIGRMAANIGVEFVIGMVPILGTLFDVHWRANVKNVDLLREQDKGDLADTLLQAWQGKRQQLAATIWEATLGGEEFRAFWRPPHRPRWRC